jgi:hypothetical protein
MFRFSTPRTHALSLCVVALVLLCPLPIVSAATTNRVSQPAPPLPGAPAAGLKPTPGSNGTNPALQMPAISPAEWQEVRTARDAAMKANPDLLKTSADIAAKMREFQQKLDAAMIQANPKVAPTIAKLEHGQMGAPAQMPPRPMTPGLNHPFDAGQPPHANPSAAAPLSPPPAASPKP